MKIISNQHGDLLLEKVAEIPNGAQRVDAKNGYIIERGEGVHTHIFPDIEGIEVYEKDGEIYVKVLIETELDHEEHGKQKVMPGVYRKNQVSDKWVEIALQTGRVDRDKLTDAIERLYAAANLAKPRVVIVPSPLVMAMSSGIAAAIWRSREAILDATISETREAILDATITAPLATYDATDAATYAAIRDAIDAATIDTATDSATRDAIREATCEGNICENFTSVIEYFSRKNYYLKKLIFKEIENWFVHYHGGNMWAAFLSYSDGMRDVIGLTGLSCWEQYQAWEDSAKYGGFRFMHEKFCMVSEFPEILNFSPRKPLHCENGPTYRWRDGFEIYHLNGVRVPKWLVMTDSGKIDPRIALREKNVDVQREIIRKVGIERMLKVCDAKTLDVFIDSHTKGGNEYRLVSMEIGKNIRRKYLCFEHASLAGVNYAQPVHPSLTRSLHARAWMLGADLDWLKTASDQDIKDRLPKEVS